MNATTRTPLAEPAAARASTVGRVRMRAAAFVRSESALVGLGAAVVAAGRRALVAIRPAAPAHGSGCVHRVRAVVPGGARLRRHAYVARGGADGRSRRTT